MSGSCKVNFGVFPSFFPANFTKYRGRSTMTRHILARHAPKNVLMKEYELWRADGNRHRGGDDIVFRLAL